MADEGGPRFAVDGTLQKRLSQRGGHVAHPQQQFEVVAGDHQQVGLPEHVPGQILSTRPGRHDIDCCIGGGSGGPLYGRLLFGRIFLTPDGLCQP